MSNRYRLVGVRNAELVAGLARLVQRGNELTAEVLAHLAELEQRMLHLELGFASLFAYCVEALDMSEGAAGRRVAAARVCRRFPEAFVLVAGGDLHLSALCALAPYLEAENATGLFEACRQKTRRQVDELLAVRFPKADLREQIRRLPGSELEPLSAGRFGVHFTADAELRELIERARAISSHARLNGDLTSLMKIVFTHFVKREEARRFAVGRKPRTVKPRDVKADTRGALSDECAATTPPGEVSRHIAAAVRREVYARDGGRCSFVAANGRRCEARGRLELDHVQPWARGVGSRSALGAGW